MIKIYNFMIKYSFLLIIGLLEFPNYIKDFIDFGYYLYFNYDLFHDIRFISSCQVSAAKKGGDG